MDELPNSLLHGYHIGERLTSGVICWKINNKQKLRIGYDCRNSNVYITNLDKCYNDISCDIELLEEKLINDFKLDVNEITEFITHFNLIIWDYKIYKYYVNKTNPSKHIECHYTLLKNVLFYGKNSVYEIPENNIKNANYISLEEFDDHCEYLTKIHISNKHHIDTGNDDVELIRILLDHIDKLKSTKDYNEYFDLLIVNKKSARFI